MLKFIRKKSVKFDLENKVEAYFLDLLNFRAISNEIATKFEVIHQSPQLLLIKNGISIYDVLGREAQILKNDYTSEGVHSIQWHGGAFPSGIYFVKMCINDFVEIKRIVLLK